MQGKMFADAEVSKEEQNNFPRYFEKHETEYMRLRGTKLGPVILSP